MSLTGSHEDDDIEGLESEEESLSDSINDSPEIVSESESASESSDIFEETENVLNEYKETIDNIRRKKVSNFKWDLQGEMIADFGKDPELVKKLYIKMNEALASLMQIIMPSSHYLRGCKRQDGECVKNNEQASPASVKRRLRQLQQQNVTT